MQGHGRNGLHPPEPAFRRLVRTEATPWFTRAARWQGPADFALLCCSWVVPKLIDFRLDVLHNPVWNNVGTTESG